MVVTMSLVLLESDGAVRTITLNAPERLNALDLDLLAELKAAIDTVAADKEAGALIVTGAGRGFSAGANVANMFGDPTRPTEEIRDDLLKVYGSFLPIRDLTIPTIGAVNGPAVGAGLNIALACDVVVAGPRAKFGPTFAAIGLHPGGGCSWMLTERIGRGHATAAMLSGDLIDAEEAWRLGLCDYKVEDALEKARELASLYTSHDPVLNVAIKQSIRLATDYDFESALQHEALEQAKSVGRAPFRRYMDDFIAKQNKAK